MEPKNIILPQDRMPLQWYNILSDIKLNPPLGPDSNPIKPEDLAPVFPMNLIEQEVSTQRWIDIPEPVLDALRIWRPSPLTRASRFEKALGTPARIYFKNESVSPPGSALRLRRALPRRKKRPPAQHTNPANHPASYEPSPARPPVALAWSGGTPRPSTTPRTPWTRRSSNACRRTPWP